MECSDCSTLGINHENWYTISNLNTQQHICVPGNNSVTSQGFSRNGICTLENANQARVKLS